MKLINMNLKYVLFCIVFFLLVIFVQKGENFVENGGFEFIVFKLKKFGQIDLVIGWKLFIGVRVDLFIDLKVFGFGMGFN